MLAGIVLLLNQKIYFVNVYACMSLNRSLSDNIFQLMWETKKSENISMCVRCSSTPPCTRPQYQYVLLDFSLTVKAATLIFISGRGSAILSAKEGKSGFIYNLVKS